MTNATELHTDRLLLRPFDERDRDAIVAYAHDPEYRRFLGREHPEPHQFVDNNLAVDWVHEHSWVICENGEISGTIFLGVVPETRAAELACLLAPHAWGRGIALEAARAVAHHAFAQLPVDTIWASADAGNVRSLRAMHKLGMVQVGVDPVRYELSRDVWTREPRAWG